MAIKVKKISDDLYLARVILPDMPAVKAEWSTTEPATGQELTRALLEIGCHQIDIHDAMSAQDPQWIEKLRGPDLPPRAS